MKKVSEKRNNSGPIVEDKSGYYCGRCSSCECYKRIRKTLLFHLCLISFALGALFTHVTLELIKG